MIREFKFKIDWMFLFLLLPLFYVAGQDMRTVQMTYFQLSGIALLAMLHCNRYLGLFLLWSTFQVIFMDGHTIDLQNIFIGLLIYQFIVFFTDRKNIRKYFWVFVGILVVNLLLCSRQAWDIDPIFNVANFDKQQVMTEFSGFMGLPAFLGNYAAVALPLAFALSYYLIPFVLIALWLSKSTFSVLAAICGTLFYFWHTKRLLFWGLLVVLGVGLLFYAIKYDLPNGQFGRRLAAWQIIEKEAFKKPFFGHGIGGLKKKIVAEVTPSHTTILAKDEEQFRKFLVGEAYLNDKIDLARHIDQQFYKRTPKGIKYEMQRHGMDFHIWHEAHNEYLQLFFESGGIGLFLMFLFVLDIVRRFYKFTGTKYTLSLMASFVAILVVSFGHFPFHLARLAGPFIVIMALLEAQLFDGKLESRI